MHTSVLRPCGSPPAWQAVLVLKSVSTVDEVAFPLRSEKTLTPPFPGTINSNPLVVAKALSGVSTSARPICSSQLLLVSYW